MPVLELILLLVVVFPITWADLRVLRQPRCTNHVRRLRDRDVIRRCVDCRIA